MVDARFYVYQFTDDDGPVYIGKGSGNRFKAQSSRFGCPGEIIERFKSEKAAYAAEVRYIAARKPRLNRHKGGTGSRAVKRREPPMPKYMRRDYAIMEALGTRVYCARLLLNCERSKPGIVEPSKLDAIRQVAYGAGS